MGDRSLAERIRSGHAAACLWLSSGAPVIAELAREAGVDAVVLDAQHGLWDRPSLEWAIGLLQDTPALVRVARNAPELIGFALDAGARGVIVPLVNSADEAAAAVAAAHYPPKGQRSGGGIRPLRDMASYIEQALVETLVCVMVETRAGLENIDAIARTPGVDLVFIGPGDLSLALGTDGETLEQAIVTIREACAAAGMACGIYTPNAASASERVRQGFRLVSIGEDISLLRSGFSAAKSTYEKGCGDGQ